MGEKPILGLRQGEPVSPVRDTKDLRFLLTQANEQRFSDIDGIRRSLIEAIGAEIPIDFLFNAGLTELNWQQIYHPNALSAVYLGTKEKSTSPAKFSDSEAIIAIHSKVKNQQIGIWNIAVSCVTADSQERKRVLSVLYDAHSFEAIKGLVSIADNEKSTYPFGIHPDYPREEEDRLIKIPSVITDSLFRPNAPLVSLEMNRLSQGDKKMVYGLKGDNKWYILFKDYFQESRGDNVLIGRRKTDDNKSSWNVSFPANLTPVKRK